MSERVIFTTKELPNRRSKSRHGTSINYSNQEYLFFNSLPFGIPSGLFCQRFNKCVVGCVLTWLFASC